MAMTAMMSAYSTKPWPSSSRKNASIRGPLSVVLGRQPARQRVFGQLGRSYLRRLGYAYSACAGQEVWPFYLQRGASLAELRPNRHVSCSIQQRGWTKERRSAGRPAVATIGGTASASVIHAGEKRCAGCPGCPGMAPLDESPVSDLGPHARRGRRSRLTGIRQGSRSSSCDRYRLVARGRLVAVVERLDLRLGVATRQRPAEEPIGDPRILRKT